MEHRYATDPNYRLLGSKGFCQSGCSGTEGSASRSRQTGHCQRAAANFLLGSEHLAGASHTPDTVHYGRRQSPACHPAQLDHVFVSLASSLHVNSGETSVRFGTAIAIPGTCPSKPAGILDLVGARPRSRASTMFKRLSSRRGAVCRKQTGAAVPGVTFRKGNAFSILPDQDSRLDWIFCDMACYPEKLLEWVSIWLNSGKCRNFVCTVKFQGNSHYGVIKKFAAFPHTAFLHLSHNKHELTWISLNVSSHN